MLDRVRGRRVQAAVELGVRRLELVPDRGLGTAGDLAPDPLPVWAEANRDRPDVAVLRRIEVDRIFAVTTTAMSCLKTPESSTLDIPASFMLMGRFAGTGSSRRPESRDASACSTVIASAAVVGPGPPR